MDKEAVLGPPTSLEQPIRHCGADYTGRKTYVRVLAGDQSRLVNADTGCRCCWLPPSYPEGRDCPINSCCVGRGLDLCGECDAFPGCELLRPFYAQPGYDALRDRVIQAIRERRKH